MAEPLGAQRPGSLRSVASNSSLVSGTSLTRRARTRARSKTLLAEASTRSDKLPNNSQTSELPYTDQVDVQQSLEVSPLSPGGPLSAPAQVSHYRGEGMGVQPGYSPVAERFSGDLQSHAISDSKLVRIRTPLFSFLSLTSV